MGRKRLNGMVVDVFETEREAVGTALFCHGFPGGIGPLPGVVFLLKHGFNVLFPQYPGSYDSEGLMSPRSAITAVAQLLQATGRGSSIPSPSVLVGHSFGALIGCCATRLAKGCTIQHALLLAPVLSYRESPDSGTREDLLDHVASIRESRPYTYRLAPEAEWWELAGGDIPFADTAATWHGPVLSIVGDTDDTFDINVLRRTHQSLVAGLLGSLDATLHVVHGAGHGMDELLDDPSIASRFLLERTPT